MDEINFDPETGWGWFGGFCGVWAVLGFAVYTEMGVTPLEGWGDYVGAACFLLLYTLGWYFVCLYLIFNPRRFSFTETGVHVWTWRGPQFLPWKAVTRAHLYYCKAGRNLGWIAVSLFVKQGTVFEIPIELFKRRESLLFELTRWLPVPLQGVEEYKSRLKNDP